RTTEKHSYDLPFMTIEEYKALKTKPKSDIALNLLKRLASQARLNVNKGYRIDIRLRSPADVSTFLVYDDLLGTLLHE
ncbi:hypothetical protein INT44_000849, partial [Umbelopsis vinacea]